MRFTKRHLNSYGYNAAKDCDVFRPNSREQLAEFLKSEHHETYSLMGAGNSFGDVFLPANHIVIDLTGLNEIIAFDSVNESIKVDGGIHVGELQQFLLQRGYFLPSCSGSINNTVAGDLSSNVNGKDSWKFGHYASNVESLVFMDTAGNSHSIKPSDKLVFSALAGGLGLIGIIVEVTLNVKPVLGSMLRISRRKTQSLEETIEVLDELCSEENDFAYAWVDSLATGNKAGRGIVESARFISGQDSNVAVLKELPTKVFGLPDDVFWTSYRKSWNLAQRVGVDRQLFRWVNSARYQLLTDKKDAVTGYFDYQFPMMSTLPNWNKRFVQYGMQEIHCIFSKDFFVEATLKLWQIMKEFGTYPELAAVRKHKQDSGHLSFAANGFSTTLNYDRFGKPSDTIHQMERSLVDAIIKFGGKIYLSKFPYLQKKEFETMYPEHEQFLVQKKRFDPENRLRSVASQRLFTDLQ